MKLMNPFLLLISLLMVNSAWGNGLDRSCQSPGFIKNHGQFASSPEKVHFKYAGKGMTVFLTNEGLSYVFDNREDTTLYRMDMRFKGNPSFNNIQTSGESDCHFNYYKGDQQFKGIAKYRMVTVKNLYPGIHWKIYNDPNNGKGLKYDFVLEPGVNPNQLKWAYSGSSNINVGDKNLVLESPMGHLNEGELLCYTQTHSGKQIVNGQYHKTGNEFRIALEKDQFRDTLVVDPPVNWATYYGGSADDQGKAIETDHNGNTFIAGKTKSTDLPTPTGTPVSNQGQNDLVISKFNASGKQQWVSVIGGSGDDNLRDMEVSQNGYAYFGGETNSNDLPTKNAHQTSNDGGGEAYLVKMNQNGGIIWSTYFGGNDREFLSGLGVNKRGDVYITGLTETYSGLATSGAFQTTQNSSWDSYLAKFDSSGSLEWSTYYGGDDLDNSKSLTTDGHGNVYVAGLSRSSSQMGTAGSYQPTYDGSQSSANYNGFLAKFDSFGNRLWGTYFGKNGSCISTGVTTDNQGNAFLTGRGSGAPTKNAYQPTANGGHEAYYSKFSPSGHLIFSTFYGGSSNDHYVNHTRMTTDKAGRLIACGRTKSSDLLLKNPVQSTYGGNEDGFAVIYDSSGKMVFSTYWGGSGKDYLRDAAISPNGFILFAGATKSTNLSTQAPSSSYYTQSANNGGMDFYLLRLDPICDLNAGFTIQGTQSICIGDSVKVTDTSQFSKRKWAINGQSKDSTSKTRYFRFNTAGTDTITMIVEQGKCKEQVHKIIRVNKKPSQPALSVDGEVINQDSVFVCAGKSFQVSDNQTNITRKWYLDGQWQGDSKNLNLSGLNTGIFHLKLIHNNNGCADSIVKPLKAVPAPPKASLKVTGKNDTIPFNQAAICENETITLMAGNAGVLKREWMKNNQVQDTGRVYQTSFPKGSQQLTVLNYNRGCNTSTNLNFNVKSKPPQPSIQLYNDDTLMSSVSANNYQWFWNDSLLPKNKQLLEARDAGQYEVLLNNGECYSDTSAGYQFRPSSVENKKWEDFKVFPNPNKGTFVVQPGLKSGQPVTLELYASQGKRLETRITKGHKTVRFKGYTAGVYLLKITDGRAVKTEKVVIVGSE